MITMHHSDQPLILLSRPGPKRIFCFPDQLGWGYGYTSLASLLEDYSVYALSFIEEEDRLSRYIDIIKKIQPVGPYVFFGHSGAGRLSFQLTRAFENRGENVSDLIFADCFILEFDLEEEESRRKHTRFMVDEFLKDLGAGFLTEKILKKAINYMLYLQTAPKLEIINANVHSIVSEESRQRHDCDPLCWQKWTTKTNRVYNAWGRHVDMLTGSDLDKNIEIIKQILDGIAFTNE